jgi:flavin reductase (DIM6/NTAB) family NADH-FMN oxidoreductase RutF
MIKEKVAPALGRVTSGLYIATGILDDEPVGMLCSFVEQAGFTPPMITIALAPDRRVAQAAQESKRIGLNILSAENNGLVGSFANPNNDNPFEDVAMIENDHHLPQLAGTLAFLVCELRNEIPAGDHHVYLLEVTDGELLDSQQEPMIRVRKNGFNY